MEGCHQGFVEVAASHWSVGTGIAWLFAITIHYVIWSCPQRSGPQRSGNMSPDHVITLGVAVMSHDAHLHYHMMMWQVLGRVSLLLSLQPSFCHLQYENSHGVKPGNKAGKDMCGATRPRGVCNHRKFWCSKGL